jgi:ribosomal protein S18 acetylase RimI-like enzyme
VSIETPIADRADESQPAYHAVRASAYSFEELADIYNQTRIDYIVPMPMNAKRMEQYVRSYDVNLDASLVAQDNDGEIAGIGMLGLRGERAWLTRLGVLPYKRRHHLGQFLMESLLEQARQLAATQAQLEVIKGNAPAQKLFLQLGFQETRELLIIRRPPGKPTMDNPLPDAAVTVLKPDEILNCLERRESGASWIDETPSLVHAGSLRGLQITLPSGESGWIVYQNTVFQMAYFVMNTSEAARNDMSRALLYQVHLLNPMQDTKIENLPALDARWPVFQELGYVEAFRRIEMTLCL